MSPCVAVVGFVCWPSNPPRYNYVYCRPSPSSATTARPAGTTRDVRHAVRVRLGNVPATEMDGQCIRHWVLHVQPLRQPHRPTVHVSGDKLLQPCVSGQPRRALLQVRLPHQLQPHAPAPRHWGERYRASLLLASCPGGMVPFAQVWGAEYGIPSAPHIFAHPGLWIISISQLQVTQSPS